MQTFRVFDFPPTLNELNNLHYRVRAKKKEEWSKIVYNACNEFDIKPVMKTIITLEFYFPDKRRRDPDNYSFSAKFIFDGLVDAGILIDDSFKEVQELRIRQGGISKPKHILIHLEEVS